MTDQQKQRHVMLSYEWNIQKLVLSVYDYLVQKQIPIWMDVKAGTPSADLYECISEAIETSVCFICFMTPEYQQSAFCKQELQYAKLRNIPIIPLKLMRDWEPSSWLGFITVGLVWLDFYHLKNFEKKATQLYNRICSVTGDQFQPQNLYDIHLIEKATVFDASTPRISRIQSPDRQHKMPKEIDLEKYDFVSKPSVQDLTKQNSSSIFDRDKIPINTRNKSAISPSYTSVGREMLPNPARQFQSSMPSREIFEQKRKEIPMYGSQSSLTRKRSPTTKILPPIHHNKTMWERLNDDDNDEDERNDCKFGQ